MPSLTSLYTERRELLSRIVHLQKQIAVCQAALINLMPVEDSPSKLASIRALHDEVFGCQIEVQSLWEHLRRLNTKIILSRYALM